MAIRAITPQARLAAWDFSRKAVCRKTRVTNSERAWSKKAQRFSVAHPTIPEAIRVR